jgi:hypothetical protein
MSDETPKGRTAPASEGLQNPAKIFIQWKSKNKAFSYYNKEKKEDVLLPMPFSFIPIHVCRTVKGYNHKKNKTFISNEVEDLKNTPLTVVSYNNLTKERKTEYQGLYSEIKDDFDQNIKYTESLYAAIKNKKGELSLVNIQLNGAGLHHWFDFVKASNIWKGSVKVSSTTKEKNGDVDYFAPVYVIDKISTEDDIKAGELQSVIKTYLAQYFAKGTPEAPQKTNSANTERQSPKPTGKVEEPSDVPDIDMPDLDDDDMPF